MVSPSPAFIRTSLQSGARTRTVRFWAREPVRSIHSVIEELVRDASDPLAIGAILVAFRQRMPECSLEDRSLGQLIATSASSRRKLAD